jgi:hypothetical protein
MTIGTALELVTNHGSVTLTCVISSARPDAAAANVTVAARHTIEDCGNWQQRNRKRGAGCDETSVPGGDINPTPVTKNVTVLFSAVALPAVLTVPSLRIANCALVRAPSPVVDGDSETTRDRCGDVLPARSYTARKR